MPTHIPQSTLQTYREAKQDQIKYLGSLSYKARLLRAGLNQQNATEQINALQQPIRITGVNSKEALDIINSDRRGNPFAGDPFAAATLHHDTTANGTTYPKGIVVNTDYQAPTTRTYLDAQHEFGHVGDKKLSPKALAYNRKLIQGHIKPGTSNYLSRETEIRNRAMGILGLWRKYGAGTDFHEFVRQNKNTAGAADLYNTFNSEADVFNYLDNFVQNDTPSTNEFTSPEEKPSYACKGAKLVKKTKYGLKKQDYN